MSDSRYNSLKLENQICFPLYACSKEIIKKYKPFLDKIDLTYTQYIAMMVLWEKEGEGINVKDLGTCLYLDSGTLTPLLKKLEAKGLITRERSAEDERHLVIKATEAGMQLREDALQVPGYIAQCANLTKEEAVTLYQLLYKILGQL